MCHLQPKVVVALVMRARGGISALLDLFLKKLGRLQHGNNQKGPTGAPQQKTLVRRICSLLLFVARRYARRATDRSEYCQTAGVSALSRPAITVANRRYASGECNRPM
jgi:hypothetical protein